MAVTVSQIWLLVTGKGTAVKSYGLESGDFDATQQLPDLFIN